jgi:hypothetical protein
MSVNDENPPSYFHNYYNTTINYKNKNDKYDEMALQIFKKINIKKILQYVNKYLKKNDIVINKLKLFNTKDLVNIYKKEKISCLTQDIYDVKHILLNIEEYSPDKTKTHNNFKFKNKKLIKLIAYINYYKLYNVISYRIINLIIKSKHFEKLKKYPYKITNNEIILYPNSIYK